MLVKKRSLFFQTDRNTLFRRTEIVLFIPSLLCGDTHFCKRVYPFDGLLSEFCQSDSMFAEDLFSIASHNRYPYRRLDVSAVQV